MAVLTDEQMSFFAFHGFLLLKDWLAPELTDGLLGEVSGAIADNYAVPDSPGGPTGTDGFYVPLMGPVSPASRRLALDPRLANCASALLASRVVAKPAKGMLYRDLSPWHRDSGDFRLRAIKAVAYLQPLTGATGALRVLPGSHLAASSDALAEYRGRYPAGEPHVDETLEEARWPGVTLATNPGDVVLFDVHLWHASLFGRDRYQWSVSYAAAPADQAERDAVRDYLESFLAVGHEYDQERYPYYDPAWTASPAGDRDELIDVIARAVDAATGRPGESA